MPGEGEFTSCLVRVAGDRQLLALLAWVRSRCGPEATLGNTARGWCWSWISGDEVLVTLPDQGIMVEMRLVEPWNA